jgi:hypothetical protein
MPARIRIQLLGLCHPFSVQRELRLWLDENELTLGDSLRQQIDDGLARCRYGVVIISQAFFAKDWTQRELNGLFARETINQKIVLPIWHNVSREFVARVSPMLANRLAVTTSSGLVAVVDSILKAVKPASVQASNVMPATPTEIQGKWNSTKVETLIRRRLVEEERADINPFSDESGCVINHTILAR